VPSTRVLIDSGVERRVSVVNLIDVKSANSAQVI
jgi:hypothetical protein